MELRETSKSIDYDKPSKGREDNFHLINTTKVIKGHKLRTSDFVRLQLLKYRHSSPDAQPQANPFKERSFRTIEQPNRLPTTQKQKRTSETMRKIKFFQDGKLQDQTNGRHCELGAELTLKTKPVTPATSHQPRRLQRRSLNKTTAPEIVEVVKPRVIFRSDNLGRKMNEYLKVMVQSDNSLQQISPTTPLNQIQEAEREAARQQWTAHASRRKTNNYMRQWKKYSKIKLEDEPQWNNASNELIESLVKKHDASTFQSWQLESRISYSMELRNPVLHQRESQENYGSMNSHAHRQSNTAAAGKR